ncbi:hypothetical protein GCM10023307_30940 [Lysobacter hankyongensis]|uniref:DUF4034 domain-containing protein n=2 Tax=Lysobacter hankyongensis TaxID=1176535 RepID=A0ABP9C0R2_9GAMM
MPLTGWQSRRVAPFAYIPDRPLTHGATMPDMSFVPIRFALVPLLSFGLAACSEAGPPAPQAAHRAPAPRVPSPPTLVIDESIDWDALLLRMQEADRIDDDVERCLNYPDVPGMVWDRAIVEARCALQRRPKYDLEAIGQRIASAQGRAALEKDFAALLQAHYDTPSERDQIGNAFEIFDASPEAQDIARRWHELSPDSAYGRLAYGNALFAAAQAMRGTRSASATADVDMRNARETAARAAKLLAEAHAAEPRLTPACNARVAALRLSGGDEDAFALGRRCAQNDPMSYSAAVGWKTAAEPRWGGSEAQLSEVEQHLLKHRGAAPLLNSVLASLAADPLLNREPDPDDAVVAALERAARIAPHGLVLNQLSASWFARGDEKRGLAYLSQAVRFNIGSTSYRGFRTHQNLFTRPAWAKLDIEYVLRRFPNSIYHKQQLVQVEENLRNDTPALLARDGTVRFDDGGQGRKATLMAECEQYGLSGQQSSEVMNDCSDSLVMEWPEDPEVWRVRADVLHARGDPRALDAARKYLEIAPADAPDHAKRAARYRQWLKADR